MLLKLITMTLVIAILFASILAPMNTDDVSAHP